MKVTGVIMTATEDSLYTSYWQYANSVWRSFGVTPTLLYLYREREWKNAPGNVISLPLVETLKLSDGEQAVISRFLLAAVVPGVNLIYDIDMFPCNGALLTQLAKIPETVLATRMDTRSLLRGKVFFGSSLCASSDILNQVFKENGLCITKDLFWSEDIINQIIKLITPIRYDYCGKDELFITQCILNTGTPVINISPPKTAIVETNLGNGAPTYHTLWTFESLQAGRYWEIHIRNDIAKDLTSKVCDLILTRG